jgi:hypothetical protein
MRSADDPGGFVEQQYWGTIGSDNSQNYPRPIGDYTVGARPSLGIVRPCLINGYDIGRMHLMRCSQYST